MIVLGISYQLGLLPVFVVLALPISCRERFFINYQLQHKFKSIDID